MAKSTNKSIADHEQTKSHHFLDEERHREKGSLEDLERRRQHLPDERGRKIEREVSRRAKK